jgi:hypothetical protein
MPPLGGYRQKYGTLAPEDPAALRLGKRPENCVFKRSEG